MLWVMSLVAAMAVGCRSCSGREQRLKREGNHAALEVIWVRHDGGAPGPRRQDRQQQPGGCLRVEIGADVAIGLATAQQVCQVSGEGAGCLPGRLSEAGVGGQGSRV